MCVVCDAKASGILINHGAVAQLVERLTGSQEDRRFEPARLHQIFPDLEPLGFVLGGFVAGEGCFTRARALPPFSDGSPRFKFVFQVTVASRDRPLLQLLREVLGFGSLRDEPPARQGWLPETTFAIRSHWAHRQATIPFFDRFLLPSAKRRQFQEWREALDAYERAHPNRFRKGKSKCSRLDCERPVRGQGLLSHPLLSGHRLLRLWKQCTKPKDVGPPDLQRRRELSRAPPCAESSLLLSHLAPETRSHVCDFSDTSRWDRSREVIGGRSTMTMLLSMQFEGLQTSST